MKCLILLALFLPFTASAQGLQNPSFESAVTIAGSNSGGSWSTSVPGWTGGGVWIPAAGEFTSLPDGVQVAYLNGGSMSQTVNVSAGTATLTVQQGKRSDGFGASATICTASLLSGTTVLGTVSQANSAIAPGTWGTLTVSATVATGPLTVTLAASDNQCDFDKVVLTASIQNIVTFTFPVQLTTCTKCDGTDDQGAAALGLLAGSSISIASGASTVCSGVLNANAQMSCSAGIDISPAMVPLSLTVVSGNGSTSYTDSQQVLGIVFMGRNVINIVALFDSTNLQPRGLRVWSQ